MGDNRVFIKSGGLRVDIHDLPTMPPLIADALRVIDSMSSSMAEIEAVIMRDQVLAANLLRVVNSAAYGMRRRIETVREAATIVGTRKIRAIAAAMVTSRLYAKPIDDLASPRQIWAHALAASAWSMEIIETMGLWDAQSSVMAALLHDVGIVLLCEYETERYRMVLQASRAEEVHHHLIEKRVFGKTHAFVGELLCAKWALPVGIAQLVGHHHDEDCPADHAQGVLMLADYLASEGGYKPFEWSVLRALPESLLDYLGIDDARYEKLCSRKEMVHARADAIFEIVD